MSFTGIGLIAIAESSPIARGLTISNGVLYEIVMQKKQYTKRTKLERSTNNQYFGKLYRKYLQVNLTDKSDYEPPVNIFTIIWMKLKNIFFIKMKIKRKLIFFQ